MHDPYAFEILAKRASRASPRRNTVGTYKSAPRKRFNFQFTVKLDRWRSNERTRDDKVATHRNPGHFSPAFVFETKPKPSTAKVESLRRWTVAAVRQPFACTESGKRFVNGSWKSFEDCFSLTLLSRAIEFLRFIPFSLSADSVRLPVGFRRPASLPPTNYNTAVSEVCRVVFV